MFVVCCLVFDVLVIGLFVFVVVLSFLLLLLFACVYSCLLLDVRCSLLFVTCCLLFVV